jgi:hypothetical protein
MVMNKEDGRWKMEDCFDENYLAKETPPNDIHGLKVILLKAKLCDLGYKLLNCIDKYVNGDI